MDFLIDPYRFKARTVLTSAPYPIINIDSLNVTHAFLGGLLRGFTDEAVDVTHAFTSGVLLQPLRTYADALPESVDVTHAFTSGVLTTVLLNYSNALPESVDVTHAFVSGVLT